MQEPRIVEVGEADREKVMRALTAAFVTDPLMRWMYPEASRYLEHFPELGRRYAGRAFGQGAAHATADFGGAALWLAPGVEPDGEAVGEHVERTFEPGKAEELLGLLGEMDRYHPHDRDIWYLPVIGVDPFLQRRGYGAALLRKQLRHCDETGIEAYLESSNPANMSLYERHGFRSLGCIQQGSVPPVHPMLRPIGG